MVYVLNINTLALKAYSLLWIQPWTQVQNIWLLVQL